MNTELRTYEHLRKLAIIDARRRLHNVVNKIPGWNIVDRTHKNGDKEKSFLYKPTLSTLTSLSLNEYGQIREIKYIVWRFDIAREELEGGTDVENSKISD